MFDWFKSKKQAEIPPLSDVMHDVVRVSVSLTQVQLQQFFGRPVRIVPFISNWHDAMIGSYVLGLVTGGLLQTKAAVIWSKGNSSLEDLGWYACVAAVHTSVFGERALDLLKVLPQLSPSARGSAMEKDIMLLDGAGGTDGMAAARGDALRNGGDLLYFLSRNVSAEELQKTSFPTS
jgi:hypothetical protein